jgi:hypothetical protein
MLQQPKVGIGSPRQYLQLSEASQGILSRSKGKRARLASSAMQLRRCGLRELLTSGLFREHTQLLFTQRPIFLGKLHCPGREISPQTCKKWKLREGNHAGPKKSAGRMHFSRKKRCRNTAAPHRLGYYVRARRGNPSGKPHSAGGDQTQPNSSLWGS